MTLRGLVKGCSFIFLCHDVTSFSSTFHRSQVPVISNSFIIENSNRESSSSRILPLFAAENIDLSNEEYDLSLFSPCKINLFLRIIGKREDGFHDLASLFQTVGFGDMLHLKLLEEEKEVDNDDIFECNMEGVPKDRKNLVLRALDLIRSKTGNKNKLFKVNLVKQVPAQAGLGGGSGNAATAMWGANELLGRPATLDQLVEWSGDLGSDITFFLSRGTAYCTGRGEIMTPVAPMKDGTKVCIVKPNIGLSTPAVFRAMKYEKLSDANPNTLLKQFLEYGAEDADGYINDLEEPAFQCLPELGKLKNELQKIAGFDHVMMSGSGTSIFCIGEPDEKDKFIDLFEQKADLNVYFTEFISRKEGLWYSAK